MAVDFNDMSENRNQCTDDMEFLNNVYELHSLYQPRNDNQCCLYTSELQNKVRDQAITIESLLHEKREQDIKVEDFSKKLFQKEQELKIVDDRVKQLENTNKYRKEVTRLEEILEQAEVEMRSLKDDLAKSKERNFQVQEEKHKVVKELKTSEESKLGKIMELEVSQRKIQTMEVDVDNMLRKTQDFEKRQELMARDIERKTNKLEELKEELK